jgi:hypothetical protein
MAINLVTLPKNNKNLSGNSDHRRVEFRTNFRPHVRQQKGKMAMQAEDHPVHVEILASQERVKSRLLHVGPFSVVLYREEFQQMSKPQMAETLRSPEIYILGERENYGIARVNGADKSRRRARAAAKGVEINRFNELAGNGRIEMVFQMGYPEQWREYTNHMRRHGCNPYLPVTTEDERNRSQELVEFLATDDFNQAVMDIGAEAHAVALGRANVERQEEETQTRPVVPMPLRVYQELCTRVPYVHEWYVLGLTHPIGHPEWQGRFENNFPRPSDEETVRSLQHNLKNVADSEWFKLGKQLAADHVEVAINAMAGCTLVQDPDDLLDGQHVDYQYAPAQGQAEQDEYQDQAGALPEQDELNDTYQEMIQNEADLVGREAQADLSVVYQGHRRTRENPRMGQPSEERLFSGRHYNPRMGQPSEDQNSPHYEPRVIQTSNFQSRDWSPVPPETPETPEVEVVQQRNVESTMWPAYVPVPTRSPPGYRQVRFAEEPSFGTETVPKGCKIPQSPWLPGQWAAWIEQERETTAVAQAEATVLTSIVDNLGQTTGPTDSRECPDAAKGRIYYAIRLGERKLAQTCKNQLCGLTGATEFPYEAYDKLTTPTYHVRTMAESLRSHGLDYNHGALFSLSCARHFNMVTYANFGKAELDDVMELCAEKEILTSIRSEGQCVVAVLPYGDIEWKQLWQKNMALANPQNLDRARAFTMIVVRAPNGAIFQQQCNYEGHGKYTGFALPKPFKKMFGSDRIRKICH